MPRAWQPSAFVQFQSDNYFLLFSLFLYLFVCVFVFVSTRFAASPCLSIVVHTHLHMCRQINRSDIGVSILNTAVVARDPVLVSPRQLGAGVYAEE